MYDLKHTRDSAAQKLLVTFLTLTGLMLVGRIYFFLDFLPTNFWGHNSVAEVFSVFLSAFRFDISVASGLIFFPAVGTLLLFPFSINNGRIWQNILTFFCQTILYVTLLSIVVSHYYYYYYNVHFNVFFWEFWENWENSKLVIWSVYDELPILEITLTLLGLVVMIHYLSLILRLWLSPLLYKYYDRKIILIMFPFLLLVGMRGTFDSLPLTMQRYREQVSAVAHLNSIHGNPYYELYFSWHDRSETSDTNAIKKMLKKSTNEIPQWYDLLSNMDKRRGFKGTDESNYLLEYQLPDLSKKYLKQKPKHIVFIFMESQSAWLADYKDAQFQQSIRKNLNKLQKQGLSFTNYFAAGSGTISNIMRINLSIPVKRYFRLHNTAEIFKSFPDTFPRIMARQGYLPRYFYGGSLSWHRLYHILPNMGFKQVFGESAIKNVSKNRFGAHDGDLFELVHQKLMQAKQPTFNFIMTLSNHPPYGVPESFISPITYENTPQELKNKILDKDNFNGRMRSLAYADQALGNYMQKAQESRYFKETLFVLTSDHSHDMNLKWESEEFYQQKKIPLIFYSPNLLKITATTYENQGSHLDLPATLLSLISTSPAKLHSWGRSLFEAPSNKMLFSFHINCLDDVCRTKEQTYVLQKDQYLTLCKETWCSDKSKQLSAIENAFWHSGYNYLFQYRIDGKTTPTFKKQD